MTTDRRQRRERKRQLLKTGEALLKHGLPMQPPKDAIIGLTLLLRETLGDTQRADRASRAAEITHAVFEASLKAQPSRMDIACRKGCGYCCHTWVSATAPEIFLLARTISAQKKPAPAMTREAILTRAGQTAGLGVEERFGRKLPCALLIDDACAFYTVRPTMCRQVTSANLESCIEEYEGRDFDGEIVVSRIFLDHASNCRVPLQAALHASGLSTHSYELTAGLTAALAAGGEFSWLQGTDIFEGVATAPAEPAQVNTMIQRIAREIADL